MRCAHLASALPLRMTSELRREHGPARENSTMNRTPGPFQAWKAVGAGVALALLLFTFFGPKEAALPAPAIALASDATGGSQTLQTPGQVLLRRARGGECALSARSPVYSCSFDVGVRLVRAVMTLSDVGGLRNAPVEADSAW